MQEYIVNCYQNISVIILRNNPKNVCCVTQVDGKVINCIFFFIVGLEAKCGTVIDTIKNEQTITLILDNGERIESDFAGIKLYDTINEINTFAVVCTGTQPNVEIAKSAGLPLSHDDGGVVVEPTLEVCPDIYAAGDIVSWYLSASF